MDILFSKTCVPGNFLGRTRIYGRNQKGKPLLDLPKPHWRLDYKLITLELAPYSDYYGPKYSIGR